MIKRFGCFLRGGHRIRPKLVEHGRIKSHVCLDCGKVGRKGKKRS